MAHIFISYSNQDTEIASKIAAGLKKLGHRIAIDTDILSPGKAYQSALGMALEASTAVVVLLTNNSLQSQYVMYEIGTAVALNKLLVPVIIGNIQPPAFIQHLYYVAVQTPQEAIKKINGAVSGLDAKRVFIVHGQNEAKKLELKNFLAGLGLQPMILHEEPELGKTIIEKFEHYAPQCILAFVLLTPDDPAPEKDLTERKWRARQNVIMELGWFMANLKRSRVIILHQGELDLPTDILGVVYLGFENSVLEVSEKIRQWLKNLDLI